MNLPTTRVRSSDPKHRVRMAHTGRTRSDMALGEGARLPSPSPSRGLSASPHPNTTRAHRAMRQDDVQLAKANVKRPAKRTGKSASKKSRTTKKRKSGGTKSAVRDPVVQPKKSKGLARLLTPKGIQDTLKNVGSIRTSVKQWLGYLQQADQILDTIFITGASLKETGVLDKLIKQRGKNLSTDDFTNMLIALMNTPVGGQLFKSFGGSESTTETPNASTSTNPNP